MKRNIDKLRKTQGCLTDCVAYYFNIHPQNVPFFIYPREGWNRRLKAFFRRRGFLVFWSPYFDLEESDDKVRLVVGNSKNWKTSGHCVVYRGNKKVYDPSLKPAMKGKPTHQLIVIKK